MRFHRIIVPFCAAVAVAFFGAFAPALGKSVSRKAKVSFYCLSCSPGKYLADPRRSIHSRRGCAADTRYHPFGTLVTIQGWGTFRVDDRGGAIKGPNRFDIRLPYRGKCRSYGVKKLHYRVVSRPKQRKRLRH